MVDRAEEKHRHKMSRPPARMGRMTSSKSPTLTAEVVAASPGTDAAVKVREGKLPAVQPVAVGFAAHLQTQRHDLKLQLLGQICGQVAAAVGDDDIVPHKSIALLFFFAPMGRFAGRSSRSKET